jgi:signal transduction histidine kinase
MDGDGDRISKLVEQTIPSVARAVDEVERLIDDVRDAARPITLEKSEVKPSTIVVSALESLKAAPGLRGFKFKTEYADDRPVMADAPRMVRAVVNILENAAHASQVGGVWVRTAASAHAGQDAVTITIGSDSYIPPEDRRRLFEKYFSKGKAKGTGLGLFIVKKIVEEHGGAVRCRSSRKRGTEFDLVVPAPAEARALP